MTTSYLLANSVFVETALTLEPLSLTALEQAFLQVQQRLSSFASDPDFSQKIASAFGEGADATSLQQAWQDGDFSTIPTIEVLTASQLNGANGAFAVSTNRIYLSEAFLSAIASSVIANGGEAISLEPLVGLLLEEIGHKVDSLLNTADSQGDEGAIFSALVQGESLSDNQLGQLKAEDDRGVITVNGVNIAVEQQNFTGDGNDNTITGTAEDDVIDGFRAIAHNS